MYFSITPSRQRVLQRHAIPSSRRGLIRLLAQKLAGERTACYTRKRELQRETDRQTETEKELRVWEYPYSIGVDWAVLELAERQHLYLQRGLRQGSRSEWKLRSEQEIQYGAGGERDRLK